jgi:hypothetical protein
VTRSFAGLIALASDSIGFRQALKRLGSRHQRGEVEIERELDRPSPALAGVALAVGAAGPDDQAGADESAMQCVRRQSCLFGGKTMRPSSRVSVVSG